MNFLKFLILIGLAGYGYHWWNGRIAAESETSATSPAGFVSAAMPDGARQGYVIVLTPENCPSEAAQRAEALANQLTEAGIPVTKTPSYAVSIVDATEEQSAAIRRAVKVIEGEVPAVFVNGRAKANPSFDEVVAEYQRTKS